MQQAITDGEVQEMKQLMKEHGCHVINNPEPSGLSPAMRCVFEAQLAPLRLLVEAGADLTARDDENWTALHVAASMDDMEAAKLILEHCKQGLTQLCNDDGERPIDLAESTEMARLLLEADLAQNKNSASVKSKSNKDELAILQLVQDHFERRGNVHELDQALKSGTNYDSLLHVAACKNYPHLASSLPSEAHTLRAGPQGPEIADSSAHSGSLSQSGHSSTAHRFRCICDFPHCSHGSCVRPDARRGHQDCTEGTRERCLSVIQHQTLHHAIFGCLTCITLYIHLVVKCYIGCHMRHFVLILNFVKFCV